MCDQDISCVFEGVAGMGAIYISNLTAAQNTKLLNDLRIKAIVTAVRGGIVKHDKTAVSDHLYVAADDIQSYDLSQHFEQTFQFIENARRKTNVLVHCYAGISRSVTIVVAYLIRKYGYSLEQVITLVKRKRNIINPNKGFVQQLKKQAERRGVMAGINEISVQQVLRKSAYSVEKKRAMSISSIRKIIRETQSPFKYNQVTQVQYNPITFSNNQSQYKFLSQKSDEENQKINAQQINQASSQENSTFFKLKKVESDIQDGKQNLDSLIKSSSTTVSNDHQHHSVSIAQQKNLSMSSNKSNMMLYENLQKIEKLKSKVLQQDSKKKLSYSLKHKQSKSQWVGQAWNQAQKNIVRPTQSNFSSILSTKLSPNKMYSKQVLQN